MERLFSASTQILTDNYFEAAEAVGITPKADLGKTICEAAVRAAEGQLKNLTRTTGFVMNNGQFSLFTDAYRQSLSLAELEVASGVTDYNTAIRNVMKPYTSKGITTIGFESGRVWSLEAAVRQCVLQGVKDIANDITEQTTKDLKTDGWEISAHVDCAPDHQECQGRQYSNKEYKELNARLARPIGVFNCRHTAYPVILGVSERAYSDKELAEMKAKNAEGITYEGKHYTLYEADQMQRKFERTIRKVKRELIVADETKDKEMLTAKSIKLRRLKEAYTDFSSKAGLLTQNERTQVAGYGRSISGKVVGTEKSLYNIMTIDDIKTTPSKHILDRIMERELSAQDVKDALINPLEITPVKIDKEGKPSKKYIGEKVTVVVNPVDGTTITAHKTHTKTAKKLKGKKV